MFTRWVVAATLVLGDGIKEESNVSLHREK